MSNIQTTARLMNLNDAAAYLAICSKKLSQLAKAGRIPAIHIDRCFRFDRDDLDAFIQAAKGAGQ
jgi:excisionase family DNA binding protein